MGQPVVLVHGSRTSRTMWRRQVAALEAAGHRPLAIDLPGHGSRRGESFTVDRALHVIDGAVDELGGSALVVGLSLGGYLGIGYAGRHPTKVRGLVAASCSTDPDTWLTDAWLTVARWIGRRGDSGAALNQRMVDLFLQEDAARDVAAGGFALDVMGDMLTGMRATRPLDDLARIPCPVWIVNGRWDHFRAQERTFVRAAPDGRLVVIRDATHLVSLVKPVAFTRVVLEAADEVGRAEA
ncbi:alpha/beta hydrolase [Cellulomonas bogoriensis 69B4 = DSM 16987]|uniref:Alpha/beta hydrolase n=1 Tax=Cellulomonas bogoriensis 69B4 = DSM 16987 TaxID=1386082 RepID=A0A0A0C580_9CELL|nr:alpha/beta hydrolase [Cellulomonas bogoriensis 69B4 = DSM 16987]